MQALCCACLLYTKRTASLRAIVTWHGHGSLPSLGSRPRHLLQGEALTRLSILHQKMCMSPYTDNHYALKLKHHHILESQTGGQSRVPLYSNREGR